ncbi:MAG: hypothetical protein ACRDQY_06745 [Pseudonocardiaceae bacterium]
MPDLTAGVFVRLCRIEHRVSPVSLATCAEVSAPFSSLSPSGDVLTVLCLREG